MKLCVNTLLGLGVQALAEAIALGVKAGLPRERFRSGTPLSHAGIWLATEFMGCMIGQVRGPVVFVQRIAPRRRGSRSLDPNSRAAAADVRGGRMG